MDAYRIIDDGVSLSIARVSLDPNGLPATISYDVLSASTLNELREIADQIQSAFSAPSLPLEECGCEVL